MLIKITSPGPVFFKQQRSGLNGRPFTLYKFRTMVTNAEQLKHELASMNEMTGPVFKVTNDPRVTGIGKMGSPACGRSAGAMKCGTSGTGSGWICSTLTIGRSGWI